ncbi:MAG: LysM peptidoglycan-binding domain-containing protein [Pseudonocardia sp.]
MTALNKAGLAAALAGLGPGGGGLQKLRIVHDGTDGDKPIVALFNPAELGFSRSVSWEEKKVAVQAYGATWADATQQFVAVAPETLRLELFFDTYESRDGVSAAALLAPTNPFATGDASDVTRHTSRVADLALPDFDLHRPPVCWLTWGTHVLFRGVLTQLDQRLTMFLPDGTPVRATLNCTFVELFTRAHSGVVREPQSADVEKTRVVRRGDTLHTIAAQEYRDPGKWRHIARANGVVDPLAVTPGTVLVIPKLVG